jgi:dihydrofolate reductase
MPAALSRRVRRIIVVMPVSVDGFFEGPGGELDWQLVGEELHAHVNEWLGAAGAFLDGRITYELMASFWPTADADPSSPRREFAAAEIRTREDVGAAPDFTITSCQIRASSRPWTRARRWSSGSVR